MSHLIDFYHGSKPDLRGRFLHDIWAWDDDQLEEVHDYIQWLFPLSEPSQFNAHAPLLTESDIAAFKNDDPLRAQLKTSLERILRFLGLNLTADGQVIEGDHFSARVPDVWGWPNHNWLRITRILRSLMLLSMEPQARALYAALDAINKSKRFPIPATTFEFWTSAIRDCE